MIVGVAARQAVCNSHVFIGSFRIGLPQIFVHAFKRIWLRTIGRQSSVESLGKDMSVDSSNVMNQTAAAPGASWNWFSVVIEGDGCTCMRVAIVAELPEIVLV